MRPRALGILILVTSSAYCQREMPLNTTDVNQLLEFSRNEPEQPRFTAPTEGRQVGLEQHMEKQPIKDKSVGFGNEPGLAGFITTMAIGTISIVLFVVISHSRLSSEFPNISYKDSINQRIAELKKERGSVYVTFYNKKSIISILHKILPTRIIGTWQPQLS